MVLNDWVADELWTLEWALTSTFQQVRAELATRVVVVRDIASRLGRRGVRADRAVAEALTIVDSVGSSEHWERVVARILPATIDPFVVTKPKARPRAKPQRLRRAS